MSMSLALEFTESWFRDKYDWKPNQCGCQYQALPASDAGAFYVSIDEAGVETGREETDSLYEILNLEIGVWRKPEHLPADRHGQLKMPQDKYLIGVWTLHALERAVMLHQGTGVTTYNERHGLNRNYAYLNALNARYGLPDVKNGAQFKQPLKYRGRGRMETITLPVGEESVQTWYGYRLRFRGLDREQKLRSETDALG